MDNKVTKKRISDVLSYDWILILIVTAVAIFIMEILFSFFLVKPTIGQSFEFLCDRNVNYASVSGYYNSVFDRKETFSFDILDNNCFQILDTYDIVSARLETQQADAMVTDSHDDGKGKIRVKELIDLGNYVYDLNKLLSDAKEYLKTFLEDKELNPLDYSLLSENLIEEHFRERMYGDNRFRSEENILNGIKEEKKRIEKLCKDTADLEYLLENHTEIFYTYRQFEQAYFSADERKKSAYEEKYNLSTEKKYALKIDALTNGEKNTSDYFKLKTSEDFSSKDVVFVVFDFKEYQEDLQYETISLLITIVKDFSNLLNNR